MAALLLSFLVLCPALADLPAEYRHLKVDDCKTSIYIGSIGMKLSPFDYRDGHFSADYQARVVPFMFYSESGSLQIDFSPEQLERLLDGQRVEFSGLGCNKEGDTRRVSGQASPDGPREGKIKVRVWVSRTIQLIFNTRYHFGAAH